MPQIPIIMPQLGESIAEATIVNLLARTGDQVQADHDIIEVETNKALMTVTAPCAGIIKHFAVTTGDSYPVGAILGQLEVTDTEAARLGLTSSPSGMVTRPDDAHPSDDTGHAPTASWRRENRLRPGLGKFDGMKPLNAITILVSRPGRDNNESSTCSGHGL